MLHDDVYNCIVQKQCTSKVVLGNMHLLSRTINISLWLHNSFPGMNKDF